MEIKVVIFNMDGTLIDSLVVAPKFINVALKRCDIISMCV